MPDAKRHRSPFARWLTDTPDDAATRRLAAPAPADTPPVDASTEMSTIKTPAITGTDTFATPPSKPHVPAEADISATPTQRVPAVAEPATALVPVAQKPPLVPANLDLVAADAPIHHAAERLPFIIPGGGVQVRTGPLVPRGRPVRRTMLILLVTACILLAGLFAIPTVHDQIVASSPLNVFSAFGAQAAAHNNSGYITYRVQPGDSIESIAQKFNATIGGIYKLNAFYIGDEISIGQSLKIPNDPTFGANYQPTAPPLPNQNTPAYAGAPAGTVYGGCLFCSIAGYSTGGACAPPSQTYRGFMLTQPNPNSRFIRGFTWYHNGVDLSTGRYGTPLVAAQDGQVIFSGWDPYGFGLAIKINHCWGLSTSYGHLGQLNVKVGQFVHKGDVIGLQGSTGDSTGPHLHYMVWWHNTYVDPGQFYDHLGFPY